MYICIIFQNIFNYYDVYRMKNPQLHVTKYLYTTVFNRRSYSCNDWVKFSLNVKHSGQEKNETKDTLNYSKMLL